MMIRRRWSFLVLGLLLAGSQGGALHARTEEKASQQQDAVPELKIISVSYGEFVPIEELAERQEEFVRKAFREGRVTVEKIAGGRTRRLAATAADVETFLKAYKQSSKPGVSATAPLADDDWDGDGFVGPDDAFPLRGEYIADIPSLDLDFEDTVEPGLVIKRQGSTTTEEYKKTYNKDSKQDTYTASSNSEFKVTFGANLGGIFGLWKKLPIFKVAQAAEGGEPLLKAAMEYTRTQSWKRDVVTEVQRFMEQYYELKVNDQITVGEDAGFIRAGLLLKNRTHFNAPLKITNFYVRGVAYSPRSHRKYSWKQELLQGDIFLYTGQGNDFATRHVETSGINRVDMEQALREAWMFDLEIAGDFQMVHPTADPVIDWRDRMGNALSRTAQFRVNFGPEKFKYYDFNNNPPTELSEDTQRAVWARQVAVVRPNADPLTVEKGLMLMFDDNVTFDTDPVTGRQIVKCINGRCNQLADKDFNTLSLADQAKYGRWVVGYKFGSENLATDLFLDSTQLRQNDVIGAYFLTKDDFVDPVVDPDITLGVNVPRGTLPNGGVLAIGEPVKVGDVVEIDVTNDFKAYQASSAHFDSTYNTVCQQTVRDATCYFFKLLATDSDFFDVPNADWYEFKVSFGTTNPRTWLLPSQLGATISGWSEYPEYKFTMRFTVTEALLNHQPQGVLRLATDEQPWQIVTGCTGRGSNGQYIDCRQYRPGTLAEHSASTTVRWYKYTPDQDIDGFAALYHYGDDWDDRDFTVHPDAEELWDGKDNNQDGRIESVSIAGQSQLQACETGTFSAQLNDFSGTLTYNWSRRDRLPSGGWGPWVSSGTGPTVTARMQCSNTAPIVLGAGDQPTTEMAPLGGFELRVEATKTGSNYRATATKQVDRYNPPPCDPPCREP